MKDHLHLHTLASYVLPSGILEYFDISSITNQGQMLTITLSEKNKPPVTKGQTLHSKGFYPTVRLTDFPIRGKSVHLLVRKRKWQDTETGKVVILTGIRQDMPRTGFYIRTI